MTRSTRTATMLGAAVAMVLSLSACGGSDSEYCDLLSDEDSSFADADPSDPEAMEELDSRIQEVVDAAPDDIRGDWEIFQEAINDPAAAAEQDPEAAMTAMENIGQHAQDECDIDIS